MPGLLDWYYPSTTGTTTNIYVPVVQQTGSLTAPTYSIWGQGLDSQTYYQALAHSHAQTALAYANQAAYERYAFQQAGLFPAGRLWTPVAPAVHRSQEELLARDREAYAKALAECNEQEAARLQRIIQEREAASAAERERAAERMRRHEEEQRQRHAAQDRAEALLLEHLTPEQRETYVKNKWFIVEGGKSKTRYRIRADASLVANVDVFDKMDRRIHRLCAHPRHDAVPLGDHLLAQKIMLELAEDDFIRVANRHAA